MKRGVRGIGPYVLVVFFLSVSHFRWLFVFTESLGSSRSRLSVGRWSRVFSVFRFPFACMGRGV